MLDFMSIENSCNFLSGIFFGSSCINLLIIRIRDSDFEERVR